MSQIASGETTEEEEDLAPDDEQHGHNCRKARFFYKTTKMERDRCSILTQKLEAEQAENKKLREMMAKKDKALMTMENQLQKKDVEINRLKVENASLKEIEEKLANYKNKCRNMRIQIEELTEELVGSSPKKLRQQPRRAQRKPNYQQD